MSAIETLSCSFCWVSIDVPKRRGTHDPVLCGVYILINGDEIVYVGSSFHIYARIRTHISESGIGRAYSKQFDGVMCLEMPRNIAEIYEGALIRELRPSGNRNCPADAGHDAEILFGLGLRDSLDESDVAWELVD